MRILILGGSHSEYPLIFEARKLGNEIFTLGKKRFEKVESKSHFFIDYSSIDEILDFCVQNRIERIISGCNDFAAIAAAHVSEKVGIPHEVSLPVAIELHNKNLWSETFQLLSIPTPLSLTIDLKDTEKPFFHSRWELAGKLIVKPVDMTGGKGIFLSEGNRLGADISLNKSDSRQSKLIIQEYLEGSLHSALFIFASGETKIFFADEEIDSKFKVRMAVMPSRLESKLRNSVKLDLKRYIEHLGLDQGLIHVQFISTSHGYKIIDVCSRPPGDLFILLPLYAFDFNFSEYWTRCEKYPLEFSKTQCKGYIIRVVEQPWENIAKEFKSNILQSFEIETEVNASGGYEKTNKIKFYRFESTEEAFEFKTKYLAELQTFDTD